MGSLNVRHGDLGDIMDQRLRRGSTESRKERREWRSRTKRSQFNSTAKKTKMGDDLKGLNSSISRSKFEKDSEAVLGVWLPAPLPTPRALPDHGAIWSLAVGVEKDLGGNDV